MLHADLQKPLLMAASCQASSPVFSEPILIGPSSRPVDKSPDSEYISICQKDTLCQFVIPSIENTVEEEERP